MLSSRKGFWFAVFGALFFSTKGVFIKLAYAYGLTSVDVLALRTLFSLPCFLFFMAFSFFKRKETVSKIKRKDLIALLILAALGYYIPPLLDFEGLNYISAGLERLVVFTYPIMVIGISCIVRRRMPSMFMFFAAMISYAGIILAYLFDADLGEDGLRGCLLVLACAFVYAVYLFCSIKYISKIGPAIYTGFVMSFAGIYALIHHFVAYDFALWDFPWQVYGLGALLGVVGTAFPAFFINAAISKIGPEKTSVTAYVGPIGTFVLAALILGESITIWEILGMGMVLIGSWIVMREKSEKKDVSEKNLD